MLLELASVAVLSAVASASKAVYNANFTKAYVQTEEGSFYKLNVPSKQINSADLGSYLSPVTAPPADAQIVISEDGTLMAIWGTQGCQKSPITVSQYSESSDSWTNVATSTENWYQDAAVVWFDWTCNTIYFYGGDCNGKIQRQFYGYDVAAQQFFEATASPMPREMAYAQAVNLDRTSTIIIGGRANNGWLSMQQVAFWEYKSWTYRSVSDYSGIDSRDSPLVLPLWSATTGGDPVVQKLLVLGGSVNNRPASPQAIVLEFNTTEGWAWAATDMQAQDACLSLYESLVDIDDGTYTIYDGTDNWQKAQVMSVPTAQSTASPAAASPNKSSSKFNVASIATLSTVIPVIVIVIGVVGFLWWWRKRKQRLTFLPRRAMLTTPDMASIGFDLPPQYASPYRGTPSEVDRQSVSDVQFLVSNRRQALRVVNPDEESVADLQSHRRERSGHTLRSHTHSRSKSSSSNISGSPSENPFDDKFDFENPR